MAPVPFGDIPRLHAEAKAAGAVALVYPDATLTWAQLERRASQRARLFLSMGLKVDDAVAVLVPNGALFHEIVFAIWKSGATPYVLSAKLPPSELGQLLDLIGPALVVAETAENFLGFPGVLADADVAQFSHEPFEAPIPRYWKAQATGGSSGRPKIIVDHGVGSIALSDDALPARFHIAPGMTVLNPGPLHHGAPFLFSHLALFSGCAVVGMERFDAETALRLIDENRVNFAVFVPTMLHRIMNLGPDVRARYDVSSLQVVWHLAAPCPVWLKQAWIDWLGPEKIWELFGASEGFGTTVIRGDEWLNHRGSVGRGAGCEVKIVGESGEPMAPGDIGEIYMRGVHSSAAPSHYLGAQTIADQDGWRSVGDLGHLDADGYLFIADRRSDMIIRGGANIYPAEIEAALEAHPDVAGAVVVGLPDDDLGARVHAIVNLMDGRAWDVHGLHAHVCERLSNYKTPESYEQAPRLLRDDAGKVRRTALRDERVDWLKTGRDFRETPQGRASDAGLNSRQSSARTQPR